MEKRSEWKLEYTMTEAFDIEDIQPRSLHELALRLAQPQSKDFVKYFNHFMVSYDLRITCDGYCQTAQVCSVQFLDKESYSKCIVKAGGQVDWTMELKLVICNCNVVSQKILISVHTAFCLL